MTTEASGAGAPKCKICGNNHWLRVGCDGLQFGGGRQAGKTAAQNNPPPKAATPPGKAIARSVEGTSPPERSRLDAQPARAVGSAPCKTSSKKKKRRAKKRRQRKPGTPT